LLVRKNPDFADSKTATFNSQLTFKEGLRTRTFWAIFAMDFCSIFPLFLISQIWKTVGLQQGGMDDYTLTMIGSLGSIANGLSRMFWGPVQDKTSFLFVYRTVLAMELAVCLSLYWAVTISPWVYMIVIFFSFVCLGAHFVMFPGLVLKVFGMKAGG
jgi:MFS family permease